MIVLWVSVLEGEPRVTMDGVACDRNGCWAAIKVEQGGDWREEMNHRGWQAHKGWLGERHYCPEHRKRQMT